MAPTEQQDEHSPAISHHDDAMETLREHRPCHEVSQNIIHLLLAATNRVPNEERGLSGCQCTPINPCLLPNACKASGATSNRSTSTTTGPKMCSGEYNPRVKLVRLRRLQ